MHAQHIDFLDLLEWTGPVRRAADGSVDTAVLPHPSPAASLYRSSTT